MRCRESFGDIETERRNLTMAVRFLWFQSLLFEASFYGWTQASFAVQSLNSRLYVYLLMVARNEMRRKRKI